MHKTFSFLLVGIFILLVFPFYSAGQISAPNADYISETDYGNVDGIEHPIYVYSPKSGSYEQDAEFIAMHFGDDSLNFRWIKYDYLKKDFTDTMQFDQMLSQSTYKSDGEGGYKVDVFNSTVDTTFYAWNYVSSFKIASIGLYDNNCDQMTLETNLDFDFEGFTYHNLQTGDELILEHFHEDPTWVANPEGINVPSILDPYFTAPVVYTRFTLTLRDNFGFEISSYYDILDEELDDPDAIILRATKADFSPSIDGDTVNVATGEAPLAVQFENLSKNGVNFEWTFYNENNWIAEGADSVMDESSDFIPMDSIIYKLPGYSAKKEDSKSGTYNVFLKSFGPRYKVDGVEEQCVDTILKVDCIEVEETLVPEFANVFTPNGDGMNEVFYFSESYKNGEIDTEATKSVKSFSIKVYSRWGVKVHSYEGDIDGWEGWDGTINGGSMAKTGVYFYSAFIKGYDGHDYNAEGFAHLFRSK